MAKKEISLNRPSADVAPEVAAWVNENSKPKKAEKEPTVRIAVDIPLAIHTKMKIACTQERIKIGEAFRKMVIEKYG